MRGLDLWKSRLYYQWVRILTVIAIGKSAKRRANRPRTV
jgi:hypothetical protein